MMVGKWVCRKAESQALQMIEESGRITDPGDRMDTLACEYSGLLMNVRIQKIAEAVAFERHFERGRSRGWKRSIAGHDERIDAVEPVLSLPQRPGRQAKAVAQSTTAVDHRNFNIALERVMLQAVVAQYDVTSWMQGEERSGGGDAIAPDPDRSATTLRKQYRFISGHFRWRRCQHAHGLAATSIPATDDSRRIAVLLEKIAQPQYQRRFAGAAGADIADHDHRDRAPGRRKHASGIKCAPQCGDACEQRGKRQKRDG